MQQFKRFSYCLLTAALLIGCDDSKEAVTSSSEKSAPSSVVSAHDSSQQSLAVLDISEREVGDLNAITLLFNQALSPDQKFSRYINVEPSLGEPVLSEDGRSLQFIAPEPLQEYEIQVDPGLKGVEGVELAQAINKKVTARELSAFAAFEVDGAIMIPGKVDALPILAVNTPEIEINVYRVKPDKVVQFFSEYSHLKSGDRWYFDEKALDKALEHVYAARLKISEESNKRNRVNFAVEAVSELEQGGVYFAKINKPGGFKYEATWFSVSAIGLQARDYGKSSQFIAQNAASGKLLSDVTVSILDHNSQVIASGITDQQGAWSSGNSWQRKNPRLILASKNQQVSVLKYRAPALDLSEFDVSGKTTKSVEIYHFSPRDIYRPGEQLSVGAIKRDADGNYLNGDLTFELFKPDGDSAGKWRTQASKPGYYEFFYDFPRNAMLGEWQIKSYAQGKKARAEYFKVKVEEFLPERLRLVFDQEIAAVGKNEKLSLAIKGEYLYGAAAAGNRLDTRATISAWASPFAELKGYLFGTPDSIVWQEIGLPSAILDKKGSSTTVIDPSRFNFNGLSSPARMQVRYSLFESGGRAINRNRSLRLWPKSSFVGLKPQFEDDQTDANALANFELVRTDKTGALLSEGDAKATLYRLEEKYFWTHTSERGWHYQIEKNEYPVATEVISFAKGDRQALSLPVELGNYRLELEDLSASSKTTYLFRAGEPWHYRWSTVNDQVRPDQVSLALDKAAYQAGDTVELKIAAPTAGTAVILLETDRVLHSQQIELRDRKASVQIPLPKDIARHDLYASVFVVAPTSDKEKVSKRSLGITHIPLDRSQRQLDVSMDLPTEFLPETTARVTLEVKDHTGKPVSGEHLVALTAVDSGVLSVTSYEQQDPHDFFYGRRAYQPSIKDMYNDLIEPASYANAVTRWGGDGELQRGGELPATDVQIVSFFKSPVQVVNGKATLDIDLPAFDGELTLTALAMSEHNFGIKRDTTKVRSPLVAQLSMPRFLGVGDHSVVALDLANVSEATQEVSLSLQAQGAINVREQQLTLKLAAGEKQVISVPVEAQAQGQGVITAKIDFNGSELNREWSLTVRNVFPAEFGSSAAVLAKGESFNFPVASVSHLAQPSLAAQLRVANTPDFNAQQHFDALLNYPYGCLEQTTSKSQPLALLLAAQTAKKFDQRVSQQKLDQNITGAISRYSELQLSNGGFGLWDKFSPEEHWLSVYATEFLMQLKQAGFAVPEALLNNAKKRLKSYVHSPRSLHVETYSDMPSHYEIAYKAFAAYVLAKQGEVNLGALRDLAEQQLANAKSSLPGVHLGLAMIEAGSQQEGTLIVQQALAQARAKGYLGDYGSVVRDTAMAINAILTQASAPESSRRAALAQVPALLQEFKQQRWFSTQEQAALLHLATSLSAKGKAGQWQGTLELGDAHVLQAVGELGENLDAALLDGARFTNDSDKAIYVSYQWSGVPASMPKLVNQGIEVNVDHFKVDNAEATLLQPKPVLKIGDLLLTRVSIISDERVPDGLLVNLLPAGLELENQNLQHALKLGDIKVNGKPLSQSAAFAYQAYQDDRYVAALDIAPKREQVIYVLSRAVTPGQYSVPPVQVESMYKPAYRGLAGSIDQLSVVP